MNITYRPISTWPGDRTLRSDRRASPFGSAAYAGTLKILEHELAMIGATNVVIENGMREQDIRLDGLPRAGAPQPEDPGVIVSFESTHGPLRYATDVFKRWEINLRAIALGLEALRRVERYGIATRGEQYAGWRQIEARSQSVDEARAYLIGVIEESGPEHAVDISTDRLIVREARKVSHPDMGGARETWDAVAHAAETLGVA